MKTTKPFVSSMCLITLCKTVERKKNMYKLLLVSIKDVDESACEFNSTIEVRVCHLAGSSLFVGNLTERQAQVSGNRHQSKSLVLPTIMEGN